MPKVDLSIIELNEIQIKNNYSELFNEVLEYSENTFIGVKPKTFREKLFIYHNDISERPTCKWCNGYINFWKFDKGYKSFCSNECSGNYKRQLPQEIKDATNAKRKETTLNKYGVSNVAQHKDIQEKITSTNIEKYGTYFPLFNEEVKNKREDTYQKNWGGHHLKNKDLIKVRTVARKETMFNRWTESVSTKLKDTYNILNFNEKNRTTEIECRECNKKTILEYYTIRQKMLHKLCIHCNPTEEEEILKKYQDFNLTNISLLNFSNNFFKGICKTHNHEFEIHRKILYDRYKANTAVLCTVCNPVGSNDSSFQIELANIIKDLNIEFSYNNRKIIEGELDIYIPSRNLAIEFNGMYWHNEFHKPEKYHLDKSLKCQRLGIELLHIFEDDWIYKKDIVKSIILNKLKIHKNVIYARKCEIREVEPSIAQVFLDTNHIQGACKSTYKIGLYYNDELVSLMTFGYRKTNAKKEFELIRFCNKINTSIVGGSSKLFKHFLKSYKIEECCIISYSDFAMFSGKLYEKLGFKRVHLTDINYYWVVNGIKHHRWVYNKQRLISEGFDPSKTEVEIMHERGYYRIFGCGQVRWVYDIDK
jgi:hypothetical protein